DRRRNPERNAERGVGDSEVLTRTEARFGANRTEDERPIDEPREKAALERTDGVTRPTCVKERDADRLTAEVVGRPDQKELHEVGGDDERRSERADDTDGDEDRRNDGRHRVLPQVRAGSVESVARGREVRPVDDPNEVARERPIHLRT